MSIGEWYKGAFIIYERGDGRKFENLQFFFSDPLPPKYLKKFSGPPQVKSFLKKNNRYIKDEKSCYLLTVIYNSVIKLPYYFVKNCLWYFY